jgi:S-adenosylmethionine decarboxylase
MADIDGLHLLVDGQVEDISVFSQDNIDQLLRRLVVDLGMTLLLEPQFKEVALNPTELEKGVFGDDGGISAFCMISTSHISIHVWPLRAMFMADVFSCKKFDTSKAQRTIIEFLHPTSLKTQSISRSP